MKVHVSNCPSQAFLLSRCTQGDILTFQAIAILGRLGFLLFQSAIASLMLWVPFLDYCLIAQSHDLIPFQVHYFGNLTLPIIGLLLFNYSTMSPLQSSNDHCHYKHCSLSFTLKLSSTRPISLSKYFLALDLTS